MFIVCYSAKFIITAIANTGKDNKTSSKKHTAVISAAVTGTAVAAAKKHHAAKKIILTIKIAFFITFFFRLFDEAKIQHKNHIQPKKYTFFQHYIVDKVHCYFVYFQYVTGF